ncbi:MAG: YihY/virulence factor BrkB family protein [Pseudomonadota bacterium]
MEAPRTDPDKTDGKGPGSLTTTETTTNDPTTPMEIADRLGWRDWLAVAKGTFREMGENELSLIAAGVAFYGFLAIFPMLAALVALYGFLLDPADIQRQIDMLEDYAPPGAFRIIESQLSQLMAAGQRQLGFTSLISLVLLLWTARAGVGALIRGLNIVFKVTDKRGIIAAYAVAYGMTLLLVVVAVLAIATVVILPGLLAAFPPNEVTTLVLQFFRWPVMLGALLLALGLLYRFGPDEARPRFAWFSVGAILAIVLWLGASAGFSYYVRNFGNYNETYGALGAVVGLLMWFYLTALIILLGGEINAQIEFRLFGDPKDRDPAFRRGARHTAQQGEDEGRTTTGAGVAAAEKTGAGIAAGAAASSLASG